MKEQEIEDNKARFKSLCKEHIHREGIDKMLDYLERTAFYTAPTSTSTSPAVCVCIP